MADPLKKNFQYWVIMACALSPPFVALGIGVALATKRPSVAVVAALMGASPWVMEFVSRKFTAWRYALGMVRGTLLQQQQRFDAALACFEGLRDGMANRFGPDAAPVLHVLPQIGILQLIVQRPEEALATAERGLSILARGVNPPIHVDPGEAKRMRMHFLRMRINGAQITRRWQEVLDAAGGLLPLEEYEKVPLAEREPSYRMARTAAERLDLPAEELAWTGRLLDMAGEGHGEESVEFGRELSLHALALLHAGRAAEADAEIAKAAGVLERHPLPDPEKPALLLAQGQIDLALARAEEAEEKMEQAVALSQTAHPGPMIFYELIVLRARGLLALEEFEGAAAVIGVLDQMKADDIDLPPRLIREREALKAALPKPG